MGKINVLKMKWHDKNAIILRAIASKSLDVLKPARATLTSLPKAHWATATSIPPQARKGYGNLDVMDASKTDYM